MNRIRGARGRAAALLLSFIAVAAPLCYASGFELQLAYCDVQGGPLLVSPDQDQPLSDGCLIQLIEHVNGGPVQMPDEYGLPADGDRLLTGSSPLAQGSGREIRVNGTEILRAAGYFAHSRVVMGCEVPSHAVYARIWNAADPAQATHFYETPLYRVAPGIQQMNFARAQLTIHAIQPGPCVGECVPAGFNVLDSYPNPFNAEATMTFALEQTAQVAVQLYDVQGRKAAELVNGEFSAGAHAVRFQSADLPSGTYFAVLRVNGARASMQRILLLK